MQIISGKLSKYEAHSHMPAKQSHEKWAAELKCCQVPNWLCCNIRCSLTYVQHNMGKMDKGLKLSFD